MSRQSAIDRAIGFFDDGTFEQDLSRRVSLRTESQNEERSSELILYLEREMMPAFTAMGFSCTILRDPAADLPFLIAERFEDDNLPTVLGYGHGDVVRGLEDGWAEGLSPFVMSERNGRWYGRGTADNKGQHSVNMAALKAVLGTRGRLGFNAKYLIEMGEERGSPGLREICRNHGERLKADLLIASDGPRLNAERPTVFLGARGGITFDLVIEAREGGHHSGNWGGALSNPGVQMAHAIASLVGPSGQIRVPELVPEELPQAVRDALADCEIDGGPDGPTIDPDWGEPGLSTAERVFGWCVLEVLAFETGTPRAPVNAIPPRAWARLQLRFVVGIDPEAVLPAVRRHLDRQGFGMVRIAPAGDEIFRATRLDPQDPWVGFTLRSLASTTGRKPALLPNLGGSLPNDIFADILKLRTIWVPHSYPGCSQHAPNEHLPKEIAREALAIMAGLYWDIGEGNTPPL
ncbi:M20 family metallopeptidase [Agrobacterium genomosp. 13]|uniref:Metallo-dependent peptidase n=1 Tax=Agrobacterium genomosp. 13 str. CFBP 6927 TaxID=1183428 RepID=A0ABP2BE45_9HYPH|nr:M20 family metallopeptidase [Agrobacterium genomosp. 13]CUX08405.1 Putative metallo-dependent peptidase [Agrobacterium genomosp. 13 str. CFBP 6927]